MKFKIDENLPEEVADLLQEAGFETATVLGQRLTGASDAALARACGQEAYALITLDTDFGDIRTYPPREYLGLIVLRLRQQDKAHVGILHTTPWKDAQADDNFNETVSLGFDRDMLEETINLFRAQR